MANIVPLDFLVPRLVFSFSKQDCKICYKFIHIRKSGGVKTGLLVECPFKIIICKKNAFKKYLFCNLTLRLIETMWFRLKPCIPLKSITKKHRYDGDMYNEGTNVMLFSFSKCYLVLLIKHIAVQTVFIL